MIKNIAQVDAFMGLPAGTIEKSIGSADEVVIPIPAPAAPITLTVVDPQFDSESENSEILPFVNKHVVADVYIAGAAAPQRKFDTSKASLKLFKSAQIVDANFIMEQNASDSGRVYVIDIDATNAFNKVSAPASKTASAAKK
jgi:hypothetical protein